MHSAIFRALFCFFVPGGILLAGTWVILHFGYLEDMLPTLAGLYLYIIAIVGVLFGWRFNRSRLVFAVLVVALADRAFAYLVSGDPTTEKVKQTVFHAISILLPLNMAIFSSVKERGILTIRGIWRQCIILLQAVTIFLVCYYERWDIAAHLDMTFYHLPFLSHLPFSQLAVLAFALAFVVTAFQFVRHRGTIESGFFWALLAILFALLETGQHASTFYSATAGLILVISAIESSHGMAFRDELTGLPARRALDESLLKLGSTYTVAMLDIDHFKKFNDKYGHQVGDQVLRMVSTKLSKVTGGGKPFRYGGEEFTVLFPGKLVDETLPYLERLRKAIGESSFVLRDQERRRNGTKGRNVRGKTGKKEVSVTVSIGAAERNGQDMNPQQVVKAADQALYKAKKAGRNRVRA